MLDKNKKKEDNDNYDMQEECSKGKQPNILFTKQKIQTFGNIERRQVLLV
jgi:hypothetical protein